VQHPFFPESRVFLFPQVHPLRGALIPSFRVEFPPQKDRFVRYVQQNGSFIFSFPCRISKGVLERLSSRGNNSSCEENIEFLIDPKWKLMENSRIFSFFPPDFLLFFTNQFQVEFSG